MATESSRSASNRSRPKLYDELAAWWPLVSSPDDYAEEAALYRRFLTRACDRPPRTLLELGCGGGNNASHLRGRFRMTLVDISPGMLAVSRTLNPACEHVRADMRTLKLGRQFDAVFVHDAIVYMRTERDLRRVMKTAFIHCRPGGAALFVPDFVRENFRPLTHEGGHDGGGRALRYLEWIHDPDPKDNQYVLDFAYMLRGRGGAVRVVQDRHRCGLFARAVWLRLLAETGFRARRMKVADGSLEPSGGEIFIAKRSVV